MSRAASSPQQRVHVQQVVLYWRPSDGPSGTGPQFAHSYRCLNPWVFNIVSFIQYDSSPSYPEQRGTGRWTTLKEKADYNLNQNLGSLRRHKQTHFSSTKYFCDVSQQQFVFLLSCKKWSPKIISLKLPRLKFISQKLTYLPDLNNNI